MPSITPLGAATDSTGKSLFVPPAPVPSSTMVPIPRPSPMVALFTDTKLKLTLKVSGPSYTGLTLSSKIGIVIVLLV